MNTQSEKAALRRLAKQRRQSLPLEERAAFSRRICERLLALPEMEAAKTVMSYMALRSEADLRALHEALWARRRQLCFPVTQGGGAMEAVLCGGSGPWNKGAFGIREPAGECCVPPEEIDVVILPCVAFDESGTRLGWGGGYYDRYLARCPQALRIGAAFDAQRLEALPRAEWDIPLQVIATEKGILRVE